MSCEQFRPFNTNYLVKTDGKVLFSYTSNGLWQVQFTYEHFYHPGLPFPGFESNTVVDCMRIPDGIRQIIIAPSEIGAPTNEVGRTTPYATTQNMPFPQIVQQELFLPWLSLCPDPELPLIDSNHMRFLLRDNVFNDPKNKGAFVVDYINPDRHFISELFVTNNGVAFQSDGSSIEFPKPYDKGFLQFSYKALATTNCQGMILPVSAVLCEYAPRPGGSSEADIYPAMVTRLYIEQISLGGHSLKSTPIPTSYIALDSRPAGLNNGVTVNYGITNDQWYSTNDRIIKHVANFYRRQPFNRINEKDRVSRNRGVIFCAFGILALVPIAILVRTKLNNNNNKK